MILKPTDRRGVFTVHRKDGEKPFAELHSPSARGYRTWGIKYRSDNQDQPFHPTVFNVGKPNRKSAIAELEMVLRVSSDRQLCI